MGANEKHAATYHGLSDDTVRGRYCDGTHAQTGHTTDGTEYDTWLAGVKAEAKAEALTDIAAQMRDRFTASWIRGKAREYTHGPRKIVGAFAKPVESEADYGDQDL